MPLKETRPTKTQSPLSDSVELGDVPLAAPTRGAGWLDAVRGTRAQTAAAPAGASVPPAPPSPGDGRAADVARALQHSAQSEAHTPESTRNAAEVTAMGSPIPVDADDADAHIQQFLSRVGQLAAAAAEESATPPGPALGPTPVPAPPPVAAATSPHPAPARTPPPPPPPPSSPPSPAPSRAIPQAMPAPWSHLSAGALMHSPFGDSHVAATSALNATSQWYSANEGDATATVLTSGGTYARTAPPQSSSTAYSSALMQALSRTEGAAALTSQWTSATHHATSTAYYSDEDSERGGSAEMPPDMYEEAMRAKVAKQQWMALEKARQEVLEEARRRRDCPFAPRVSAYAARMQRPTSLRPENRVGAELIRRKQWTARKQQEEVERELQACTFRPLTLRTARLDPAAVEPPRTGTGVFHHLYTDAEDRRTFEREVKPELLNQLDDQHRPSPVSMRPTQLAEVLGRLCSRGAVRGGVGGGAVPAAPSGSAGAPSVERAPSPAPMHQPVLSSRTQRIVAAQRAAGERDDDIVAQLYRHAERGAVHQRLKRELDAEQARVVRAEQAVALAEERKRLQQEYCRSVLAAKYRVLAQHAAAGQHSTYRATAPHSVVQLARAALDVLSADETEELLGAVETCGQQRLTEAEFVAVVLQHLSQHHVAPSRSALLSAVPPRPLSVPGAAGASCVSGKRAGSAAGRVGSADSSPTALPQVKREKPDPELIAHVRARRAEALEEWKQEHQRRRAVCDGIVAEGGEYTFQPAPRHLIPYECRPDVTVPVNTTKSEALRRAYVSARLHGGPMPATMEAMAATAPQQLEAQGAARELFSHHHVQGAPPSAPVSRARSQSTAGARSQSTQRERSAAAVSPVRAASTSRPPRKMPAEAPPPAGPSSHAGGGSVKRASYASAVPPPPVTSQQQAPTPSSVPAARGTSRTRPAEQLEVPARMQSAVSQTSRGERTGAASSLVEQIMHSSPADRARLGRELLMRQLREHQRRAGGESL